VRAALLEAERRGVTVLLTTDHGSIHCATPATVYAKRDATANLRYKFGEDLRSEDPEAAVAVEDLKAFGLPAMGLGVRLLLAAGDRFFVYPTKLREYQARYRGSFLHGGVTPEEVILPVALLTPRSRARGSGGPRLARIISDTDQVKTAVTAALASFLRNVSLILVYLAILVGLSWRLTIVALVLAPVLVLIIRPIVARVRRRSREQADDRGEL